MMDMQPTLFNTLPSSRGQSLSRNLRMGTCSWKYDSWKGLVYDPAKKYSPMDYLADYARQYLTVEIDEWFWSLFPTGTKLPNPKTVQHYADSVPDDFLFTVKAPNAVTLTHFYAKQPAAYKTSANLPNPDFLNLDLLKRFLDRLAPMHDKLGAIIFQFEYLNKQKMPSLNEFLDRLADFLDHVPSGFDYAVEIRNPRYYTSTYNAFLRQYSLSPVLIDGTYMPPLSEVIQTLDIRAGKKLIIRLQGPDRQKIEKQTHNKWDTIVSPQDAGLSVVSGIVKEQLKEGRNVIVSVNNHYEGCAPLTIQRLVEKMTQK